MREHYVPPANEWPAPPEHVWPTQADEFEEKFGIIWCRRCQRALWTCKLGNKEDVKPCDRIVKVSLR